MKGKVARYFIVVLCVIAILFGLYKVLFINTKLDTYLALGDYLRVSGNLKGEEIISFSTLLGDYLTKDNLVSNVNKVFEESGLSAKVTRRASQDDCRRSIYLYIVTYIRDTM